MYGKHAYTVFINIAYELVADIGSLVIGITKTENGSLEVLLVSTFKHTSPLDSKTA